MGRQVQGPITNYRNQHDISLVVELFRRHPLRTNHPIIFMGTPVKTA